MPAMLRIFSENFRGQEKAQAAVEADDVAAGSRAVPCMVVEDGAGWPTAGHARELVSSRPPSVFVRLTRRLLQEHPCREHRHSGDTWASYLPAAA